MTMSTWMCAGGSAISASVRSSLTLPMTQVMSPPLEFLGAIALVGLAHRDGYVEVAFGTCSGFGLCLTMLPPLSIFLTSPSPTLVADASGNDCNADEDDRDRPDVGPSQDIEQHELNDRRDGDGHDRAGSPPELVHHEVIQAPQDEQGRDVDEEFADAVYWDEVQEP